MSHEYSVTKAVYRLIGSDRRFTGRGDATAYCKQEQASIGRTSRLRGEMEHMSHEQAVNRYMTRTAKQHEQAITAIYRIAVSLAFAGIGAIAVLFYNYI